MAKKMKIGMQYSDMCVKFLYSVGLILLITSAACRKFYPYDKESIGPDSRFVQTVFKPILGRAFSSSKTFYYGSSTHPAEFKLINPRFYSGAKATILTDSFKVLTWIGEYTGLEKSLEEINAKRAFTYRPLFEMNKYSGNVFMWPEASSKYFKTFPDSCYLFDVEYANPGGRRYFRDLKLIPFKERPYEPLKVDPISGIITNEISHPIIIDRIYGRKSNTEISNFAIDIYIKRNFYSSKNQITIKMFDNNYNYININKFNDTKWEELIHGFNVIRTDTTVTYQIAYPIPIRKLITKYTNESGDMARIVLGYKRLGYAQQIERPKIVFDFAIYEPGDWQIVYVFSKEAPKFENE